MPNSKRDKTIQIFVAITMLLFIHLFWSFSNNHLVNKKPLKEEKSPLETLTLNKGEGIKLTDNKKIIYTGNNGNNYQFVLEKKWTENYDIMGLIPAGSETKIDKTTFNILQEDSIKYGESVSINISDGISLNSFNNKIFFKSIEQNNNKIKIKYYKNKILKNKEE